jgi:hypothetical protein
MRTATDITSARIGKSELHPARIAKQLADAEAGIRQMVAMLQAGHSLMLHCTCREYERCHRKVVEMMRISIAL